MSKYQEAVDAGYNDDQLLEYFKPKIDQAMQSVGEEKTKAYLMDSMGFPQDKLNYFMGKPTEQNDMTKVPTEQAYVSVPKLIKQYLAEGSTNEEAVAKAKADYYHSKGFPAAEAGEQFGEHITKPFKEGIATVGAGFVSLVDDLMSGVGLQNDNVSKNIASVRDELKRRETQYEDRYGADVVREVSKNIPSILTLAANPTSAAGMLPEIPLAYAQTRGSGGTVGEATTSAAITAVVPAAMSLYKATKALVSYPETQKSKILQTVNEQAKKDMLEVLQYAEEKGLTLTPAQLTDNKTINQLTDLVTRTPAVAGRFAKISDENKALLMEAYVNLKHKLSPEDVSTAFVNGEVDPFGAEVKKTLNEALKLRKQRTNEAYATFDDLANEIDVPENVKPEMIKQLNALKEWGKQSNNPEGVAGLINDTIRRVKGKVTELPEDSTETLAKLFKGYEQAPEDAAASTLSDLNNLSKQLYKQSKNITDPTLKSVWGQARQVINDNIAKLADPETLDVLNVAKAQHTAKERLYGLNPDFKNIANTATEAETDTIIGSLLNGTNARSNALNLKKEFALAGRPEMSQALAKRYIEDKMEIGVKEFKDIGKYDIKEVIAGYSKLDPEIVKLLAGESAAKELRMIVKLSKSSESLDKLTSYQPMTGSSPRMMDVVSDYIRGAIQNKVIGDVLSSKTAMNGLLKIWSKDLSAERKMGVARDLAKAAGISDTVYRPKPLSDVAGSEAKTIYSSGFTEGNITRGPLGKGSYYTMDESKAMEQVAGTNKTIQKMTIDPSEIATMDTVSHITGKKATFKDVTPSLIKNLKLRGFTGLTDEGELVIFDKVEK